MGLRDDVKERRQAKIRTIVERYHDSGGASPGRIREIDDSAKTERTKLNQRQPDTSSAQGGSERREDDFLSAQHELQIDPELAWKKNPNPWASWDKEDWSKKPPRSYVGAPYPDNGEYDNRSTQSSGMRIFFKELKWKFLIALILFAAIWGIFRGDEEWATKGQGIIHQAMKDEFDFEAAAAWYEQLFSGAPSFIPIFQNDRRDAALVDGQVKQTIVTPLRNGSLLRTFAELLNGIELAGEPGAAVSAAETGRVIQVSKEQDTVIIQHANNRVTVYGKLGEAKVHVNDWVEAGDEIGKLQEANESGVPVLYFAVKQDDQYMDPVDVIPFD
ncbi:M23 family metallopeptidase [Paenibacillus sp. HB172176]|uniref:M23 family metallopeptidase n=1 Tax=Paenibacillus sp. HB172176 TaxID=2493690 RepID=UPI001438CB13|nr:M23 family metallopeptidase [Paenibacillus sp. HB172176]